jgi:hypothetical protein
LGVSKKESDMTPAVPSVFSSLFSLFNHLRVASRLPPSCDYMLFKSPILPCWEDSHNSSGGRWVLYFSKPEQVYLNLDVCWLASVSFLISSSYFSNTNDSNRC